LDSIFFFEEGWGGLPKEGTLQSRGKDSSHVHWAYLLLDLEPLSRILPCGGEAVERTTRFLRWLLCHEKAAPTCADTEEARAEGRAECLRHRKGTRYSCVERQGI
jgi:hypothetical protein